MDGEGDVGRPGLLWREGGGAQVIAGELTCSWDVFGDVEKPGSGAGAYVCDLGGGKGELDVGVDEESKGFGSEDVLLV